MASIGVNPDALATCIYNRFSWYLYLCNGTPVRFGAKYVSRFPKRIDPAMPEANAEQPERLMPRHMTDIVVLVSQYT